MHLFEELFCKSTQIRCSHAWCSLRLDDTSSRSSRYLTQYYHAYLPWGPASFPSSEWL